MGGLKVDPNRSVFLAVFLLPHKQLKVLTSYLAAKVQMKAIVGINLASPESLFGHKCLDTNE